MRTQHIVLALSAISAACSLHAASFQWTNALGGIWSAPTNWSPNGVPGGNDSASITNDGTYTVIYNTGASATLPLFVVGGGAGQQSLVFDGGGTFNLTGVEKVATNGVLVASNLWMNGALSIRPGGRFHLEGASSKVFYSLIVSNQGTIVWNAGNLSGGGSVGTQFYNSGLFQITGDNSIYNGGGGGPVLLNNSGMVRKTGGTGTSSLGMALTNQPGAEVDCLAGTLAFSASGVLGGAFVGNAPGRITLTGGNWTDAGGTFSGTGTNQFTGGILNLRTNPPSGLQLAGGDIYLVGTNSFQDAGAITNLAIDGATLYGSNAVSGTLAFTSGSISDRLTIRPGGQWLVSGPANKLLYGLASLENQGTVVCGGNLGVSGLVITNKGLWQFTNDSSISWGGNAWPTFINSGTVSKTGGSGNSQFYYCNFINLPSSLVKAQTGTVLFFNSPSNVVGGTYTTTAPGQITFSGTTYDAGGVCNGNGTSQFVSGVFNLRSNNIPGLQLIGGDIYVTGTNTFQQAGAITNLTLDGSTLRGTNTVGNGALTFNAGKIVDRLTVRPGGLLSVSGAAGKTIYDLTLINQGTVACAAGMNIGGTVISNGGLWQFIGDVSLSYGGGTLPVWTNAGVVEKTAGVGTTVLTPFGTLFFNQPGGMVKGSSGTLQLPAASTNFFGALRANGGLLNANGTLAVAGGTLDGVGTIGLSAISGGTIAPGVGGPGLLAFSAGLNLGSNATLVIDCPGLTAGSSYDQIAVTGTVSLAGCALQLNSLPYAPLGSTFVIINNDGIDAIAGAFASLPEGSTVTAINSAQASISYHGGTGNDVVLTLTKAPAPPRWTGWSLLGDRNLHLTGSGLPNMTHSVLASTNLGTTNWMSLGAAVADGVGGLSFTDLQSTNFPQRFYRLRFP